ncbi:MAG: glutathione synthase, partial [Hyphomicrobiales bacterium]|nr:glutathione synthase [Hyphomicrobiales bacterium]
MPLTVAVQMDHISSINIAGDSTFALLLEAAARGHRLYHYTPDRLAMRQGVVTTAVEPLEIRDIAGDHYTLQPAEPAALSDFDVVLLRQDPPFDLAYITTTHMLERVHPRTLVVNDPAEVRNAPEKLFVVDYADLMPETLITHSVDAVRAFRAEVGDIVIKPLYGNGGRGVFRVRPEDENFGSLIDLFRTMFPEPCVVQRYLPEVRAGDKRIILVDSEAVGAINRIPAEGEARSNMHVGGRPEPIEMTAREREIC